MAPLLGYRANYEQLPMKYLTEGSETTLSHSLFSCLREKMLGSSERTDVLAHYITQSSLREDTILFSRNGLIQLIAHHRNITISMCCSQDEGTAPLTGEKGGTP
jgi:hypothetical protein